MTTNVSQYCSIHGYDFSSIIYAQGIDPSGGELGVEELTAPGRKYADVRDKGRSPKKYKVTARSTDRDEIEAFLAEVNTAPEDSEFYPFDAERFGLIASAHAVLKAPQPWGAGYNFYEAEAEITCREPWLYGPDKGITFAYDVALPAVSEALENEGQEQAPISYMQASGDYVSGSNVEDLSCRITLGSDEDAHDREMQLCEKMLRDDIFEVGWRRREVQHSWEANFGKLWSEISLDLHSKTSGGSITDEILTLDDSDYLMIPFYGPLPISGEPGAVYLELQVTALSGDAPTVMVAIETDLHDMAAIEHDAPVVGLNTIYIPNLAGQGHVAIGIQAAESGSVSLSGLKGVVKRYVAPYLIPWADPGESFKIRVESTAGTQLAFLQLAYNDRYYY
jgi:hypothetical protein